MSIATMTNLIKCILVLSGLMASSASVQLPSSINGFLPPSPFYFYNPATLPTLNSPTSKQDITYHDYPTSTLLGSHVVFLTTCLKDLKDSNQKLAQTSKLLEEIKNTSTNSAGIENVKNELNELKEATAVIGIFRNDLKANNQRLTEATIVIETLKNDLKGNTQRLGEMAKQFSTTTQTLVDSNTKVDTLTSTSNDMKQRLTETTTVIETLKNDLNVVKQDVQSSKSKIGDLTTELTKSTAASSIGKMPGSCGDLQRIGHNKSGLFSIMDSNKIVNVYCDFTKPSNDSALQKWIGYTDVKSLPTYFYVQKRSGFSTLGVPIPFEIERLNIGGAMNIKTGKFTAPRKGVYFFAFSGVSIADRPGHFDLGLMVNGVQIGRAECASTTGGADWETLTLQSTIELKMGDLVWLQIIGSHWAYLQDNSEGQFTHFSGWLLQEDLSP
ncbi:uncharacterized protein LOC124315387 isoform X4 [Daphnia pulicaria]|uniref:uncharacterized protein LOC124315387 isoform X4 n=1 Tax=Daphnia pulicaria TaxID=35523 RepID=UPI001EEC94F4|nr:uncharacterized protein LOC124315387 isoform X4 [Daphnia pulicaria]